MNTTTPTVIQELAARVDLAPDPIVSARVASVDLVEGDVILDPDPAAFAASFVWVEGGYSRKRTRVLVVRPILPGGTLAGRQVRELPQTTYVTAWPVGTPDGF